MMKVTGVIFGAFCFAVSTGNLLRDDWGYEPHNGPKTWDARYPRCGHNLQSPIALPSNPSASNHSYVNRLTWHNFELERTLILQNNGKYMTLKTKLDGNPAPLPYNKGSIFAPDDEFLLEEVQFRWGEDNRVGSEHSIAGKPFPGEMTVISWNSKYRNLEEASRVPGGVISSVFFLDIQPEENVGYHLDELPNINGTTKPREIPESNYVFLFPVGHRIEDLEFFVYEGSSTYPPCTEGVVWHVYTEPVRISEEQMNKLRSVVNPEGQRLVHSSRPIQPQNNRKVFKHINYHTPAPVVQTVSPYAAARHAAPVYSYQAHAAPAYGYQAHETPAYSHQAHEAPAYGYQAQDTSSYSHRSYGKHYNDGNTYDHGYTGYSRPVYGR